MSLGSPLSRVNRETTWLSTLFCVTGKSLEQGQQGDHFSNYPVLHHWEVTTAGSAGRPLEKVSCSVSLGSHLIRDSREATWEGIMLCVTRKSLDQGQQGGHLRRYHALCHWEVTWSGTAGRPLEKVSCSVSPGSHLIRDSREATWEGTMLCVTGKSLDQGQQGGHLRRYHALCHQEVTWSGTAGRPLEKVPCSVSLGSHLIRDSREATWEGIMLCVTRKSLDQGQQGGHLRRYHALCHQEVTWSGTAGRPLEKVSCSVSLGSHLIRDRREPTWEGTMLCVTRKSLDQGQQGGHYSNDPVVCHWEATWLSTLLRVTGKWLDQGQQGGHLTKYPVACHWEVTWSGSAGRLLD